ncbi:alpha-ketoglutarate-dependent dioxygenase alkB homolog 4-like [Patiria miniata]|uniref:Fe2OG dioxygenase domain-containing protein n=1 Tax=Patiria miniata TaxID=46514 RepID=A0A914BFW4_PATMI|nr:alpha-ketoglutarate-dependent dioxygenase alkB homolog 4-like [Patiria miniata]
MGEYEGTCGCKGIRTCLICEQQQHKTLIPRNFTSAEQVQLQNRGQVEESWESYCYCWRCNTAWGPRHTDDFANPPITELTACDHTGRALEFPGVTVVPEFVSKEEEAELVRTIDASPWKPSQSGRVKQDYGPKVNFKRRKLKTAGFTGLPSFIKPFVERMNEHESLSDFIPVEQCNLDYRPERGSAIDPHLDDSWLWGERLVTINLISGTYLDMTPIQSPGNEDTRTTPVSVRIPLPPRSLLVLSGPARHQWNHGIRREAIVSRRIAVTLRELTGEFLVGGAQEDIGREVLSVAKMFTGTVVP